MIINRFDDALRALVAIATPEDCAEAVEAFKNKLRMSMVDTMAAIRSKAILEARICPQCGSKKVHRHGWDARRRQRFLCVGNDGCGRSFGVLQGTVFQGMKKSESWLPYLETLLAGISVSKIAEDRIGISRNTAWRWRHRFLSVLSVEPPPLLSGIVEADETYFTTSYKGSRGWLNGNPPEDRPPRYRGSGSLKRGLSNEQVPVLCAVDRNRNHIDRVLPNRSIKSIVEALGRSIHPGSVICSDGHPAYEALAEISSSEHHIFNPKRPTPKQKALGLPRGRKGALGLGRIGAWHLIMRVRFDRLHRGVSTAHLQNYLTMMNTIHGEQLQPESALKRAMERFLQGPPPRQKKSPTLKLN